MDPRDPATAYGFTAGELTFLVNEVPPDGGGEAAARGPIPAAAIRGPSNWKVGEVKSPKKLLTYVTVAGAVALAGSAALAAAAPPIKSAASIQVCVQTDGNVTLKRGTLRVVKVAPTNLKWSKRRAPAGCRK